MAPPGYGTARATAPPGYGTSRLWHHRSLSQLGRRHIVTWAGSQSSFCLEDPTSCSLSCSSNTSGGRGALTRFGVIAPVGMKDSFPQAKSCRLSGPPGGPAPFSTAQSGPGLGWALLGPRSVDWGTSRKQMASPKVEFWSPPTRVQHSQCRTCSLLLFITRG